MYAVSHVSSHSSLECQVFIVWYLAIRLTQMSQFKTPIVLDTGSGLMKAGFADQDLPTTIFPTVIGVPKYEVITCSKISVQRSTSQYEGRYLGLI